MRRAGTCLVQRLALSAQLNEASSSTLLGAVPQLLPSTSSAAGVRHATGQAVKQRIRAIKNIGKITKAMKMVAASKMRNAQVAVEGSRGIVHPFVRLLGDFPAVESNKAMILSITSDKGLCGGLNSNISKYTRALVSIYGQGPPAEQTLVVIGDKGRAQLARTESARIIHSMQDTFKVKVTFAQASLLAEELVASEPEAIRILFNKFQSAISFKPTIATILSPAGIEKQMSTGSGSKLDAYEIEAPAEPADLLKDLAEFQLAATLFNALLENNVSEHASRMTAMENSTSSASDMLSRLTLQYNRNRQATITTELIEIIAGASALVDAE